MFADGSIAVAVVRNQVMVVRSTRTHNKREKFLDVHTYAPFGDGVFLASDVPTARIASSDILTVLPPLEGSCLTTQEMLHLPTKAVSQYTELTSRHQKRYESLWNTWVSKK